MTSQYTLSTILAQHLHPFGGTCAPNRGSVSFLHDQITHVIVDDHQLVHRAAPAVTRVAAGATSLCPVNRAFAIRRTQTDSVQLRGRRHERLAAVGTKHSHQ